jgi:hypothetical protein
MSQNFRPYNSNAALIDLVDDDSGLSNIGSASGLDIYDDSGRSTLADLTTCCLYGAVQCGFEGGLSITRGILGGGP